MANDLRDPRYQQRRPTVPKNNLPPSTTRSVIFLIVGAIFMATGVGFVIGIVLLIAGISGLSAAKKASGKDNSRPAEKPAQRPSAKPAQKAKKPATPRRGPEICDNPEPHRHFETKEPCDNDEAHSHYDVKYTPSGKVWPTDQEKRLLNMRRLYEAGLLTREEYDDEVRKLKKT